MPDARVIATASSFGPAAIVEFSTVRFSAKWAPSPPPIDTRRIVTPLPLTKTRTGGVHPAARLDGVHSLADYVARYDAEIRFFDDELGRFLDRVDRLALPSPPLLVFTSASRQRLGDRVAGTVVVRSAGTGR